MQLIQIPKNNGQTRLIQTYEYLIDIKRPQIIKRIRETMDLGVTHENSEFEAAKEELTLIDIRIEAIKKLLNSSKDYEETTDQELITLGSSIHLRIQNRELKCRLVDPAEIQTNKEGLSAESPIGKAIYGKRAGYRTIVETPKGQVPIIITKVIN
jgi:transcription elongation factor GreA